MELFEYIKPELLILIPVLNIIGLMIKNSKIKNNYIPLLLTIIAIVFCIIISLSGPVLGREALGWFVDMSAIGASIGFLCTSASALKVSGKDNMKNINVFRAAAVIGVIFSLAFMVLQLVPIPGLEGVHFVNESYLMLIIWCGLGLAFFAVQKIKKNI